LSTLEDRFNLKYKIDTLTGCWVWIAGKDKDGYGVIWNKEINNNERAHRVSLRLVGREVPKNLMALHSCDNPSCVNPEHLSHGDNKQNQLESVDRGLTGDLNKKRSSYYMNMDDDEFKIWKSKFQGKVGKSLSNLSYAINVRRNKI